MDRKAGNHITRDQHDLGSFSPAFTTLSEVVSHLNLTGPDNNGNYTVFGLTISTSSLQSQIDHANKYIASLVPTLSPGCVDPR